MEKISFNDFRAYRQALKPLHDHNKLLHGNLPEREEHNTENISMRSEIALILIFLVIGSCCLALAVRLLCLGLVAIHG